MAVKTSYKLVPYDLSKGQLTERGPARPQGMIPARLIDLRYEGNTLVSRPKLTAFASGVYGAAQDITGGSTDGSLITASVTNMCSDGARVFGQTTITVGQSNLPDAGVGQSSYVTELKNINGTKTWTLTDIPAPRAVTPLASTGPFSGASFGSGTGSDLLLTNFNLLTHDNSPDFFVLNSGASINDPAALKKSSVLARFPGLTYTRVAGSGYTVSYDSVGNRYIALLHDGLTIKSWALLNTSAAATIVNSTRFDALMIGEDLYLIVRESNVGISMYRYDMTSGGSPISGSITSTPTNLSAANESSYAVGVTETVRSVCISSQSSPAEFRFAYVMDSSSSASSVVGYVRRNLTTLAAVGAYASASTGPADGNILNITCNGNVVLAEWNPGGGSYDYTEFVASATAGQCFPIRKAARVYAYVWDGGTALTEKALFPEAASSWLTDPTGGQSAALQTYLYSHISSDGYVAIGDCIYQVLEVAPTSPGVQKVVARFIAKALDYQSSGAMYGDTATFPTGQVPRAMREYNSLSRWVSERYVALPLGATELAAYWLDSTIGSGNGRSINGMLSNERLVVFDLEAVQLTASEIARGVTALGHGFAISTNGEIAPWCSVSRPIVRSLVHSYASDVGYQAWVADEIVSYRAVAVSSCGGIESYIASSASSITVAVGDINKSILGTVELNGQCPTISKIRIYRSRTGLTTGSEFYFLTEVDPPVGSANSVTFTDNRADISARPIDPTGGGSAFQGNFLSGLRDVTSVAGRVYVSTSEAAVPCQIQLGDDILPTPMVDRIVYPPSSGGKVKHVSSLFDSIVVSSENAIYGLAGDPPGTNDGPEIVAFTLSDGTGCNGKPISTPAGLMIPRTNGILLVDRSRNAQEISDSINGDKNTGQIEFSGKCAYSVENDEAYFGKASGQQWMVLSTKSARWTEWHGGLGSSPDVATCNRGGMSGLVAFTQGAVDSADVAAPRIVLGWDSFPNRFTESKVRRVLIDGYRMTVGEEVGISLAASYNLDDTPDTAVQYTVPAYSSGGRHTQGFRAQMSPARRSGSSFKFDITLTPPTNNKLSIETIAVEVMEEVKSYVAGVNNGAPEE